MIALQARNPQLPDPSRQTAQYANMMNMARQQEAAQRQAQQAQQAMTIAAAKEGRDVETQVSAQKKAEIEYVGLVADQFSRDVGKLKEGDIAGAEALRANIVKEIPAWGDYIRPASEWTQDYRVQLMLKGKEIADKTIPDIVASKEYTAKGAVDAQGNPIPEGTVVDTRIGGFSGAAGSTPLRASGANTPAPRATPTAPQSNPFAADAPPANTAAENVNSLGLVIASARETGVMAQSDVDKLLSAAAPGSAPKLMAWLSQNNIQVAPDAPGVTDNQMRGAAADLPSEMRATPMAYDGQTPESQFADLRGPAPQSQTAGLRGAPPMEQTLAQYIPVQRRDPNMGAYPGSAQVPIERVRQEAVAGRITPAEAAANARATKNVDVEMAPQLATATKTAERTAELKIAAPKAQNATLSIIADIDDRINTIDEFLRSPNRRLINGPIEGNLPRLLQTGARADAQAAFDKIKNTATLTSLIDLRKSTETGASPVGANPTDRDARIVEQAASKLIQTGELSKMDAELIAMRKKLYRTRVSAASAYDAEYGDVIASNPRFKLNVPPIADRYISTTGSGKKGTSTKVDRNNPLLRGM
jgi:hypothetical protein